MEDLRNFLRGKKIYLDVNVFIYALEPNENMEKHFQMSSLIFEMADNGEIEAMTSELTLAEALVGAFDNQELLNLYEDIVCDSRELRVFPVNKEILKKAAFVRHKNKTALADAIHVATALRNHADVFITNDKSLKTYGALNKLYMKDWIEKG